MSSPATLHQKENTLSKFIPEWVKGVVSKEEDCDVCGMIHLDDVECDTEDILFLRQGKNRLDIQEGRERFDEIQDKITQATRVVNWTEGMPFKSLVRDAYEIAKKKGWWDQERDIPHCLALIHSEVSEALEEYREYGIGGLGKNTGRRYVQIGRKPEGFAHELADIIIRVADLAGHLNVDLSRAVKEKMDYNATREYRHGNKKA